MKFKVPPAMSRMMKMARSGKVVDATALINATLAANLPSASRMSANAMRSGAFAGMSGLPAATPAPEGPAGSSFEEKAYQRGGASIRYRLYRPSQVKAGMPLVVMLHGCTQNAEDFARGTGMNALAEKLGFLVAYPIQTQAANAQKCWNWFKPSDQERDRGEPGLIAGLTQQIIAEHQCDRSRVYIAGLSAGGAAAAIMANAYPDIYAAVGIHSGLPCGAARDIPSALSAMKQGGRSTAPSNARFVPLITFHGDQDATVNEINSRHIVSAAAQAAGSLLTETDRGTVAGGRRYTRERSLNSRGETVIEQWTIHGGGHAWSGGSKAGTYTDEQGPDASSEMMRFFLSHRLAE